MSCVSDVLSGCYENATRKTAPSEFRLLSTIAPSPFGPPMSGPAVSALRPASRGTPSDDGIRLADAIATRPQLHRIIGRLATFHSSRVRPSVRLSHGREISRCFHCQYSFVIAVSCASENKFRSRAQAAENVQHCRPSAQIPRQQFPQRVDSGILAEVCRVRN